MSGSGQVPGQLESANDEGPAAQLDKTRILPALVSDASNLTRQESLP
jgi:hypothetical protein